MIGRRHPPGGDVPDADPDAAARRRLLEEIAAEARQTARLTGRAAFSPHVMAALAAVPRDAFVRTDDRSNAWENRPLAIGHGQTISQPYIVALMTDLLDVGPEDRVLEIGSGSGYQAAILAEIAGEVYGIEVVPQLAAAARQRLAQLGYDRVDIAVGDGWQGRPEAAPFDAILISAAPPVIPGTLSGQLKPGGRMVVPVGPVHGTQTLWRCVRDGDGGLDCRETLAVAFVPMIGGPSPRG